MRNLKRAAQEWAEMRSADLLLQKHDVLEDLAAGVWVPHVDVCQTESRVVVRAELPGVATRDIKATFEGDTLHLEGVKREETNKQAITRYLCMERRYGRFDRRIHIDWIVNPRQARAHLDKGILTIDLPKLRNKRGAGVNIPISKTPVLGTDRNK